MKNSFLLLLFALLFLFPCAVEAQQDAPASSCIGCHSGMQGRLGEPVEQWQGSIHQENGISCSSCHGGDPTLFTMEAMSPEKGFLGVPSNEEIPEFCGSCHVGVLEDYIKSAHGQALGEGGPQCVICHGNHSVKTATLELINQESCTQCHEYGRAGEIKEALAETDQIILNLEDDIQTLHRIGIATDEMKGKIFSIRNQFHRLFHTVDVQKVRNETEDFQLRLQEVRTQVEEVRSELTDRKVIGAAATALLLLAAVLGWILRRTYKKDEEQGRVRKTKEQVR